MPEQDRNHARILIIDDQEANVRLMEKILRQAGYLNLRSTLDSREAIPVYEEFRPDLVLLDLHMPHCDGFEVMARLKSVVPVGAYVPILVLTADVQAATKRSALAVGAKDFLTKPFDATEVVLRIRNLLETRSLYVELGRRKLNLEEKVRERTLELQVAQIEMLEHLARASESRDDATGLHTQRVGQVAAALARAADFPSSRLPDLTRAAALHDIGKIGIPDTILLKPGKLTADEFRQIKRHTTLGGNILSGSCFPVLQLAEEVALYHHERWDGTGYNGLAGEAIPVSARIVTLADVFDVLTHARCYKDAWPLEKAREEVERQSGRMFDPFLVEVFLRLQWTKDLRLLSGVLEREVVLSPSQGQAVSTG
jgi:putative two-component system response regulator